MSIANPFIFVFINFVQFILFYLLYEFLNFGFLFLTMKQSVRSLYCNLRFKTGAPAAHPGLQLSAVEGDLDFLSLTSSVGRYRQV